MSLEAEVDREREVIELREALRREQRKFADLKRKHREHAEVLYQAARDGWLAAGTPKAVPRPPRDKRKGEEIALVHFTDWQLGKRTKTYNSEVCCKRIDLAVEKVRQITEIQRHHHPVNGCHLFLGGDMLENVTIFPSQAFEVDSSLFAQFFTAANQIERVILSLLEFFQWVSVTAVYGNHGRIGRKGDLPRDDNLDRMIYRVVRDKLSNQPRLTWQEQEDAWEHVTKIGNYRALLFHGDEISRWGGNLPTYGIVRRVTEWATGVVDEFDDAYLGHFHQDMKHTIANGARVFITPSPESDNRFAKRFVAAKGRPAQRLHFVNPRKGRVTSEHLLWLDEVSG